MIGFTNGTYAITPSTTATGTNYTLSGSGTVNDDIGAVQVSGLVTTTVAKGIEQVSGSITLSDAKGSFRLDVAGTISPTPMIGTTGASGNTGIVVSPPIAAFPMATLTYTVVDGTGAFANLQGTGAARLSLVPTPPVGASSGSTGIATSAGGGMAPVGIATFLTGRFFFWFSNPASSLPLPM
jgi:hypothetical protein